MISSENVLFYTMMKRIKANAAAVEGEFERNPCFMFSINEGRKV